MKTVRHGLRAHSKKSAGSAIVITMALLISVGCQRQGSAAVPQVEMSPNPEYHSEIEDDLELDWDLNELMGGGGCTKANAQQLAQVNAGNLKAQAFLNRCALETLGSPWCEQLTRPNPDSKNQFFCTYSPEQPHMLIHPDESTWVNAITAVKLVKELQTKAIKIDLIYNWWRPEPYNANVGGAAGRHPFGTSIDVRFATKADQTKAHGELCKLRKAGRLRALGWYASTALHLGVGDHTPNTWGKDCP
ncbi:MAG: hypothetical protein V4760_07010 [Bdellovibrionota bacterium]